MECRFVLNPVTALPEGVKAPNGAPSLLYEHIKNAIPEDYQPDLFVLTFYGEGEIKGFSKEEVALALYIKYNALVKDRIINKEEVRVDKNGEPLFTDIQEALNLPQVSDNYYLSGEKGAGVFIHDLEEKGLIEKKGEGYQLSNQRTLPGDARPGTEQNLFQINQQLNWLGIHHDFVSFEERDGVTSVVFDSDKFIVTEKISDYHDQVNTRFLIGYLADRFPQLRFRFVTEKEAEAVYNQLPELSSRTPFEKVNSFVDKAVVYLIEGRVTSKIAIEETLHPFVYSIAQTNKELFDQLHQAAQEDFPKLENQINKRYTAKAGFTEEDRRLELVTQALSRVYSKEARGQEPQSIRAVLPRLVEWLLQLLNEIGEVLAGNKHIRIHPKELSADTSLSQIAKALNTYDSAFLIDADSMNASFSLSSEKEAFRRRIVKKANALQKKVIDDLFHPRNPVVYDGTQKTYLSARGKAYSALNTDLTGNKKDPEADEGLRKLFGRKARHVLELMALGEKFEDIKDRIEGLSLAVASRAYKQLQKQLNQFVGPDSIIMPRMVIADHTNKAASTLDILILQPDGNLTVVNLKVSDVSTWDKEQYERQEKAVGSASKLKGESLTLRQLHGIRAAASRQLLENNGYRVDNMFSLHIHLPKEKEDYILKIENIQHHAPTENRGWVNKLLPVAVQATNKIEAFRNETGQGNPVRDPDFLTEEEQMPEEPLEEPVDHLTVDHATLSQGRKEIAREIDELVRSVQTRPKSIMVQKLSELMKFVQHDLTKGEVDMAYGNFLRTSLKELDELLRYLSDDTKIAGDPEFARIAIEASWFIESYQGIGNAFKLHIGNQYHTGKLIELEKMLKNVNNCVDSSLKKYIQYMVKTVSNKELTRKDLEDLVNEAIDISKADYLFGDMATSRDTLIAVADKIYKREIISSRDDMIAFDKKVKAAANEYFEKSGGVNEMHKLIEDGGGRIVQEIGPQYYNLKDAYEAKTRTAEGVVRQYREIESLAEAAPEDLAHNKEVYKNKQALREFREPEMHTEDGPEDGMYHTFIEEFKMERLKYEKYTPIYDENGVFIKGTWEKRDPNMSDAVYFQYKRKYYQEVVYDKAVFENGEFTGMVIKNGGKEWFVKEEYIQIRKVAGDGTDMISAKWRDLQADTSEKGRALLKFFEFYLTEMEETLKMLPPNVYKDMLGKLARVQGNFVQKIKKSPSRAKAIAKTIKDWFSMRVYAKSAMYNEDGTVMNQIPIFFVGNLRNQELIDELSRELDKLDEDYRNNRIERLRYLDERSKKTEELQAAEKAISHDEINTDLVENLIAFRTMAENYRHLNAIEGTVHAVERMLAQRSYKKMAGENELKIDPHTGKPYELKDGTKSYSYRRFRKWMEMVFYNSQDLDSSTFDVVVKKLMSVTSLESVGFNSFGAIHNYLMARINTIIESAGGLFYTRDAAWRAFRAFESEFLPGRFRASGDSDKQYKTRRPGSKYEALVKLFHIYRQQQSGENRINFPTLGFPLMEAGEYSAQTKSGIAYLMSHDLKNEFTNETVSIYDAFDFNEETGELTLKAGFSMDPTAKLDITNSIWEMNKQIHGNYDWMDRMVIQQETVGQVAAQFHKWVYPAYKSFFQSRYFDENLGWMEGRFRTIYHLIRYMYQAEGSFLQRITAGFKQLDEIQIKNMYKNAASLGFFVASFAAYGVFRGLAGDTDDDKKTAKRWLNFLSWESDRIKKEIAFWVPGAELGEQLRLIKNPFAIGTTMSQFAGMVSEGFKLALPPYDDDVYYKHGPFQGELKFKKKLFDLLPVMKDINKWQAFSQVTNFQIQ